MDRTPAGTRRPPPMGPNNSGMQASLRTAMEAMQAAANAMVAATESYNQQNNSQGYEERNRRQYETHPPTIDGRGFELNPVGSDSRSGSHRAVAPTLPNHSLDSSNLEQYTFDNPDHFYSPHHTAWSARRANAPRLSQDGHHQHPTPMPRAPPPLSYPRPLTARSTNNRSSRVGLAMSLPNESTDSTQYHGTQRDWTTAPEGSTASLAPLVSGDTRDSSHRDQDPWTSRHSIFADSDPQALLPPYNYPLQNLRSSTSPRSTDEGTMYERPHIMKIGRHTYVRSDTGTFEPDMLDDRWQLQQEAHKSNRRSRSTLVKPPTDRPHGFSLLQEVSFVLLICIAQALMLAGIAQALVPQYIIGRSFPDTSAGDLAWYSASYGLTAGTFVLPSGRLGDLFGHKKIFIIGFLWLGIWELIGGFANLVQSSGGSGTIFFILCRAMMGTGASLLVPNGQATLGRAYKPGPRKNIVMCLFGAAAPFGFVTGATMSSLFAEKVSWEWGYWVMAIVCALLAAVSVPILPPTEQTTRNPAISLWTQLDVGGMFLGVGGLILLNFGFNQAPIVSWNTPYTYFIVIIGVILLVAFIYVEMNVEQPLVPIMAMQPMTNFVLGCTAAGWGCFSIWVYYAFNFMQELRGWSPLLSCAAVSPAPFLGLFASLLTGFLFSKHVKPQIILLISMIGFFVGSLFWATAPVNQTYWINSFLGVLIIPFGMDMSNPAASILLSNSVAKEHQGIAASLVVTTVNYSISLALGIAGSAEVALSNGGENLLAGYRAAQYVGLGIGGFGILLALVFVLQSRVKKSGPASAPKVV